MKILAFLLGGILWGCSDSSPPVADAGTATSFLVWAAPSAWLLAGRDDDPFAGGQGARVRCGARDFQVEDGVAEITTRTCGFATLVQPVMTATALGDQLRFSIWWQTLASDQVATARVVLAMFGDRQLWATEVAIPSPADAREVSIRLPSAFAAGDLLYFHVENHGYNSWRLGPITVAPSKERHP